MKTRMKQFTLLAVLGVILSLAFSATASAEQCSPDGKICLVTPTPVVLPTQLEFRVASGAAYLEIMEPNPLRDSAGKIISPPLNVRSTTLVEQGPPDGMSRWVVDLGPNGADYTYGLEARARRSGEVDTLSFLLPTIGSVNNLQTKIVRTKKQFVAFFTFEGRVAIKSEIELSLGARVKGKLVNNPQQKRRALTTPPLPPGQYHVLKLVINRKAVQRLCRPYNWCSLSAGIHQSYPYYDPTQGRERAIDIPYIVGINGKNRIVKDRNAFCRKLRAKNKRAYRKRCLSNKRNSTTRHKHHARS